MLKSSQKMDEISNISVKVRHLGQNRQGTRSKYRLKLNIQVELSNISVDISTHFDKNLEHNDQDLNLEYNGQDISTHLLQNRDHNSQDLNLEYNGQDL